jgi:hypothetical protein
MISCVLALGGVGLWQYETKTGKKEVEKLTTQLKKEQENNVTYTLNKYRIQCMTKTLILAYNLSKWEAYYYSIMFNDFSISYGIPWEIYPSIIRIESNFNPTALSPKSCKGVMQLKEATAKEVAKKIDMSFKENTTLWSEVSNIVIGCSYLSTHIKNKGLHGGVKSYLGGPDYLKTIKVNEEAKKYITEYKASVWIEFIQLSYIFRGIVDELGIIPYKELHEYSYSDSIFFNTSLFPIDSMRLIDTTIDNIVDSATTN